MSRTYPVNIAYISRIGPVNIAYISRTYRVHIAFRFRTGRVPELRIAPLCSSRAIAHVPPAGSVIVDCSSVSCSLSSSVPAPTCSTAATASAGRRQLSTTWTNQGRFRKRPPKHHRQSMYQLGCLPAWFMHHPCPPACPAWFCMVWLVG